MKFEYLELQNWKCFKEKTKWDFKDYELITKRNGTGKTSMFQAIIYLLYSKIPTGFNLNTVRNNDEEECKMKLRFVHNYSTYEIIKNFGGKKKVCELWIDQKLVARSVKTVDEFINSIVDKRIAVELWTQSLTESGILAPSYINTVILEDVMRDPMELKSYYKSQNFSLRKEIREFKGEVIDLEALEKELNKIQLELKEKGSSREELNKALKIQALEKQYLAYNNPSRSKEEVLEFLSILENNDLEFTQEKIKAQIQEESKYLEFESLEKPEIDRKTFEKITSILNGSSVENKTIELKQKIEKACEFLKFEEMQKPELTRVQNSSFLHLVNGQSDLELFKEKLASQIQEESKYLEFENLEKPSKNQEETEEFLRLAGFNLDQSKEELDEKIKIESAYKDFENRKEPKYSKNQTEEFLSIASDDVKSQLLETSKELIQEQEKTINRFLGISKNEILKCVDKSLETHECVFCKSEFDSKHQEEILEELDKPSRDDKLIEKLKEKIEILERYESKELALYDLSYWDEKLVYEQKIKDTSYLDLLISNRNKLNLYSSLEDAKNDKFYWEMKKLYEKKIKDTSYIDQLKSNYQTLSLYESIDEAKNDKKYWDAKDKYEEAIKDTSYLDELNNQESMLQLYNSSAEYEYDVKYWKAKDLYDVKSENTSYLDSLKVKIQKLTLYNDVKDAENDKNYYNYKELFDNAANEMSNYKEVIENHDSRSIELWDKHDELQKEYIEAVKQKEELDRINNLKKVVEDNANKLEVIEDYIYQASNYYIQNIVSKTSDQLSKLNERYKAVDYNENGFFVIVEDSYKSLNIIPVSQLSSGEKTIFALSLLFAIHDVMTPDLPFMFDETFAQLDKENLEEVKKLLESRNDQIFVITHDLTWNKENV